MLEVPRLEAVTNLEDMETEKGSHFAQGIHVPKSCVRMFDVWIHRVCAFAVFFLSRYRYDATCE